MRKRAKPLLIFVGLILAIGIAVGVLMILPEAVSPTLKPLIFFVIVVVIYFIVTVIGTKLSR